MRGQATSPGAEAFLRVAACLGELPGLRRVLELYLGQGCVAGAVGADLVPGGARRGGRWYSRGFLLLPRALGARWEKSHNIPLSAKKNALVCQRVQCACSPSRYS